MKNLYNSLLIVAAVLPITAVVFLCIWGMAILTATVSFWWFFLILPIGVAYVWALTSSAEWLIKYLK